uniref:Reverse transcriptase domain-containing protein n=1 Tax=Labrus bergylta TaxID=56723 RepID=A0A3Q3G4N3_9LABR
MHDLLSSLCTTSTGHVPSALKTAVISPLLNRLHSVIGLSDSALDWFCYLTERTEHVSHGVKKSRTHLVTCGVPQGSVLGPTLFNIYMPPLGHVISQHGISFHCYADDTQIYLKTNQTPSASLPSSTLTTCLEEIEVWMKNNFPKQKKQEISSFCVCLLF